jgi:hypothetical protein
VQDEGVQLATAEFTGPVAQYLRGGRGLLDLLPQFDSKLIPGSMRRPG